MSCIRFARGEDGDVAGAALAAVAARRWRSSIDTFSARSDKNPVVMIATTVDTMVIR